MNYNMLREFMKGLTDVELKLAKDAVNDELHYRFLEHLKEDREDISKIWG